MEPNTLRIGIDVGSVRHRVAVGLPDDTLIDEFDVDHHVAGFSQFFHRIAAIETRHPLPVAVAMESYNDWARPLDGLMREHGWTLYNVNKPEAGALQANLPCSRQDRCDRCAADSGAISVIRSYSRRTRRVAGNCPDPGDQ